MNTVDVHAQLGPLERLVMPGPVAEAHAKSETECAACHAPFERDAQRQLCLDCHDEIATDLATGTGFHSRTADAARSPCAACHTEHGGRDADIVGLDERSFDHGLTDFPLSGKHEAAQCTDCHDTDETFHAAETQCFACHADDDEHRGGLGTACADCHSETGWQDVRFDHEAHAGYALTGAHVAVQCTGCHLDERYESTPTTCSGCHRDDDTHMGANGSVCQDCHTSRAWSEVLFDHFMRSGFALAGAHSGLTCESCHEGNKLERSLPEDCFGCHRDDDTHDGLNGAVCDDCHRATTWLDTRFDHARDAGFALGGAHARLACAACHVEPVAVAAPPTECAGCHAADDPHRGQLGARCATCHGELAWRENVRFDHDLTRFPLLGNHGATQCTGCHATPAFHDTSSDCVDCHGEDDVHERRLGNDCGACHNPRDWLLWSFDHDTATAFPLDGAHAGLDCRGCHREPVAATARIELETACVSCHRGDDVHRGEFGPRCESCHVTESFEALRVRQ